MLIQDTFLQVIASQKENLTQQKIGLDRDALQKLPHLTAHVLIVSGIRRCGKSTLLFQLLRDKYKDALYLNFEDPRLYDFELNDFRRLDEAIKLLGVKVLLFDEVQIIPEWEKYVRQKLDEDYKIVVTGSNASLLSRELGTKLTGRHITKELFPFSFQEFNKFFNNDANEASVLNYLKMGGFPEYVKNGTDEILHHLFEDILIRDIAVRYGVRDVKNLQRLALYLISNVAKPITGNRLKSLFNIASTSTIMEYLSHLEYAYLFQFVPKFSFSLRKQLVNPRKVYAIDTGMVQVNSASFSDDDGRKFENLIYLKLRREHEEIYYFADKGECDFVVFNKGNISEAIQVCYQLNQYNIEREINGLIAALEFFKLKQGKIVTLNQSELIEKNGFIINVVTSYQWL
jgi:predicted AAA+ superfamily ATPase